LKLDRDIEDAWPAWRVVLEGKASLKDLDYLSIDDVDLCCLAIDAWQDAERRATKRCK